MQRNSTEHSRKTSPPPSTRTFNRILGPAGHYSKAFAAVSTPRSAPPPPLDRQLLLEREPQNMPRPLQPPARKSALRMAATWLDLCSSEDRFAPLPPYNWVATDAALQGMIREAVPAKFALASEVLDGVHDVRIPSICLYIKDIRYLHNGDAILELIDETCFSAVDQTPYGTRLLEGWVLGAYLREHTLALRPNNSLVLRGVAMTTPSIGHGDRATRRMLVIGKGSVEAIYKCSESQAKFPILSSQYDTLAAEHERAWGDGPPTTHPSPPPDERRKRIRQWSPSDDSDDEGGVETEWISDTD